MDHKTKLRLVSLLDRFTNIKMTDFYNISCTSLTLHLQGYYTPELYFNLIKVGFNSRERYYMLPYQTLTFEKKVGGVDLEIVLVSEN